MEETSYEKQSASDLDRNSNFYNSIFKKKGGNLLDLNLIKDVVKEIQKNDIVEKFMSELSNFLDAK